mmetsp:Transcript_37387/g.81691  ORF Transcript_37387/g.81691 Transcript_37387/m.81691 type:complete len:318 (-) Transcript_37387:117-1070(-)
MAVFSDIGDRCALPGCGIQDFLPFPCDKCNNVYCVTHCAYRKHECPVAGSEDRRAIVCLLCKAGLPLESGSDPNVVFHEHEKTCPGSNKVVKCPAPRCRNKLTSSGSVVCPRCKAKVCLEHRFEDAHPCNELRDSRLRKLGGGQRLDGVSAASVQSASAARPPPAPAKVARSGYGRSQASAGSGAPVDPRSPMREILRETAARRGAPPPPSKPAAAADAVPIKAQFHAMSSRMPAAAVAAAKDTLVVLLGNVVKNPGDAKFRTIKRGNPKVHEKIGRHPECVAMLKAAGFVESAETWDLPMSAPLQQLQAVHNTIRG